MTASFKASFGFILFIFATTSLKAQELFRIPTIPKHVGQVLKILLPVKAVEAQKTKKQRDIRLKISPRGKQRSC